MGCNAGALIVWSPHQVHITSTCRQQHELSCQARRCRYGRLNAHPEAGPDLTAIPTIKARFLRLHGVIDLRDFISGWFHGAPFEVGLLLNFKSKTNNYGVTLPPLR
jgi:hypothetical protein